MQNNILKVKMKKRQLKRKNRQENFQEFNV